jgi:hypothetical protein
LALNNRGSLKFESAHCFGFDLAFAIDRATKWIDDATEEAISDRNRENLTGTSNSLTFFDTAVLAEDDNTDLARIKIERKSERSIVEFEQLVGHRRRKSFDSSDAIACFNNGADFIASRASRFV